MRQQAAIFVQTFEIVKAVNHHAVKLLQAHGRRVAGTASSKSGESGPV